MYKSLGVKERKEETRKITMVKTQMVLYRPHFVSARMAPRKGVTYTKNELNCITNQINHQFGIVNLARVRTVLIANDFSWPMPSAPAIPINRFCGNTAPFLEPGGSGARI